MRLLIKRTQPFADEPLVAAANFTWLGNSMGAHPDVLGREDLAGGLPNWSLIGVGATRLFVVEASHPDPDRGVALFGSWPLIQLRLSEQMHDRKLGSIPLGAYRAIRFEFPDRGPAVLQPFGREVDAILETHRAARPQVAARPDGLAQVSLMTTSGGPASDDVFFVLTYLDGTTKSVPLGEDDTLLTELQDLPGFDNETFVRAMAVSEEGMSVLWRANTD
jgi:hypothetical protein